MGGLARALQNEVIDQKLIQNQLQRIKEEILEVCLPEKIVVFGSAARGEARVGSGLDIAVFAKRKSDLPQLRRAVLARVTAQALPVDWIFSDLESLANPDYKNGVFDRIIAEGQEL